MTQIPVSFSRLVGSLCRIVHARIQSAIDLAYERVQHQYPDEYYAWVH